MNILDVLKQLRDDIKTWVANNLNELNKRLTNSINNIPKFSGDYNDLMNAPNISEDDSGNMIIADESGNIIFKADTDGIHTTAVSLNGEAAATEKYVDVAIQNAQLADKEVDLTNYYTKQETNRLIPDVSNFITEDYLVANGYITDISGKADIDHKHDELYELKGAAEQIKNDLLNGAGEAYDALKELGDLIDDNVDAIGALEAIATNKADKVHSHTEYLTEHQSLEGLATKQELSEHTEDTNVHVTYEEKQQWSAKSNFSGSYNDLENAPNITEDGTSDLVIADANGNIIFRSNGDGFETTNLTVQNITINGKSIQDLIREYVNETILGGEW